MSQNSFPPLHLEGDTTFRGGDLKNVILSTCFVYSLCSLDELIFKRQVTNCSLSHFTHHHTAWYRQETKLNSPLCCLCLTDDGNTGHRSMIYNPLFSCKLKPLHKQGTSRQSWRTLHVTVSLLPDL